MPRIDELLRYLKSNDGSDLHLACGIEPRIRRHGSLHPVPGWGALTDPELRSLLREIATEKQWAEFSHEADLDFAYGVHGLARFRANYFVQERGATAVFRIIPEKIISLEQLNLPPAIEQLAHLEKGLVLVTGPTGSGKSTTLAAIIDRINSTYAKHIITIEDPVEFVHKNKRSIISHREVGSHAPSFSEALRAAVREDADVVVVGEMRDLDTIGNAITAAEMGVLVFGTLHTSSAPKTIDRLIDAFPAEQQSQIRTTLSESLTGVVSQLLLKKSGGEGRVAVNEILLKTPGLANLVREGKPQMLYNLMQSNKAMGMQTMDDALMKLVQEGVITPHEAYLKAANKVPFERMLPAD